MPHDGRQCAAVHALKVGHQVGQRGAVHGTYCLMVHGSADAIRASTKPVPHLITMCMCACVQEEGRSADAKGQHGSRASNHETLDV